MEIYKKQKFPLSRIATIDICEIGKYKHHIAAMVEIDVTKGRETIRAYNQGNSAKISFTSWIIYMIASTLKNYETAPSFLKGKNKLMIFNDINVSIIVEKEINGQKVPIPLVIEKAQEKSPAQILNEIQTAQNKQLTSNDIVLQKKTKRYERLYYILPDFLRRSIWKFILQHPTIAFQKMGNVAFTSITIAGQVNGWFIPISIHPICFGLSSIVKKPVVINNEIKIREMLNLTVLMNHDVIDGTTMARFISDLSKNIENGEVS